MLRFLASRLLSALGALIGASLIAFLTLRVVPGDPARLILGAFATDEALQKLREEMGLNAPLFTQYFKYLSDFVSGNWGFSYSTGEAVVAQLAARLPATLELGLSGFALAVAAAIVFGPIAAFRPNRPADKAIRGVALFGLGVPQFWLGLMLMVIFFEQLHLLPGPDGRMSPDMATPATITGFLTIDTLLAGDLKAFFDALAHLLLPAVTLALAPFAFLVRLLRANLLDKSRDAYVLVARSRGLSRWRAFITHALPNAALPTLSAAGLLLGQLLAGSVLVERSFNWPGIGALVTDSILRQDFAVVQAFILLSACAFVITSTLVDLLAAAIDPRLRLGAEQP
jgi:ABC-type dipeptide/oligopeptide/nickel transport system permease component